MYGPGPRERTLVCHCFRFLVSAAELQPVRTPSQLFPEGHAYGVVVKFEFLGPLRRFRSLLRHPNHRRVTFAAAER